MFKLEGNMNPLDRLVAHAGSEIVEKQLKNNEQKRINQEIMKGLNNPKLGPNASIMDRALAIEAMDIPREHKDVLHKVGEASDKYKFEREKLSQPKSPAGGLSGQPVPENYASKLQDILSKSEGLNADQLALKLDSEGIPRTYSNSYIENRRRQDESSKAEQSKRQTEKAGRHSAISSKVLQKADEIAESLPQKESAHRIMEDAIKTGNLGFWTLDNLAEITGLEGLRSPEGSVFKTAVKEYFLSNVARAGARPNQWIEQQIADMMTKIGRSTAANLSVSRALKNELDIDKERIRITNQIADELEEKYGYVPRDLGSRVNKELSKYAESKQDELFNDMRAIKAIEEKKPQKFKQVSKGTKVSKLVAQALLQQFNNDPKKASEEAAKLGYTF